MEKIPFTPAEPEPVKVPIEKPLDDNRICRAVIAAILVKAGVQTLALTQDEFLAVARLVLLDGRTHEGHFMLALGMRDAEGTVHPFDPNVTRGH